MAVLGSTSLTRTVTIEPRNVQFVASYNWVDSETQPTILVPGSPPEWLNKPFPYHIPYDHGVQISSHSYARMGPAASPLLPLFRAADVLSASTTDVVDAVDWPEVDVVTDRKVLRNLLRWLRAPSIASSYYHPDQDVEFRVDIQLAGKKTLLLHPWDAFIWEDVGPESHTGRGVGFERESTSPGLGCERGESHHRVVRYDMGGLNFVVSSEVDACIAPQARQSEASAQSSPSTPDSPLPPPPHTADCAVPRARVTSTADIAVLRAGAVVPHDRVVELKTRSLWETPFQYHWPELYPQMALSHTHNLFVARHAEGEFRELDRHTLDQPHFRQAGAHPRMQEQLRQLVAVLRRVQRLAQAHAGGRGRLALVCRDGKVGLFEQTGCGGLALQEEDLKRFGRLGSSL
ncbi:uncharacterized protein BXZ73DRAFT_101329 [Epithele typhae]|uniref:uncharacterized protein n=1 Tax=Epithele typhae TaxID=378194 RepID=UPI0020085EC5|nr:uncharacterized protein BXZ73DRAFT_101329 [Epithele typhae]KAH9932794.1 hypothetical protein BXZ73DRAFT_101329 [Epithele typhae]